MAKQNILNDSTTWGAEATKIEANFDELYNEKANHGYGEGEEPKTLKEVEDNANKILLSQYGSLFSIENYYIGKSSGGIGSSPSRKTTDYLPILVNDLYVTGYDGGGVDNPDPAALIYFYDKDKLPLGFYSSGTSGRKTLEKVSKEFIQTNYPTARYVRASANNAQSDAVVLGINIMAIDKKINEYNTDTDARYRLFNNIIGTNQVVSFANGLPSRVTHRKNEDESIVRTDNLTFSSTEVIEVRELSEPNVKVEIKTNLETLKTTIKWI